MSHAEESRALRRAKRGDADAARAVVEARYPMALDVARKWAPGPGPAAVLGAHADADDLAQELALSVYESLRRFKVPGGKGTRDLHNLFSKTVDWGFRGFRANALYHRRRRPEPEPLDADGVAAPPPEPEDGPDARAGRLRLEHALESLTPRERQVVRLAFGLDGGPELSNTEVGRALGVPRKVAGNALTRALPKLRAALSAGPDADGDHDADAA